ncbi:hypothetical protein CFK37_00580 [Virgibacillus phasianinus]|uniref:Uncharacterized protein n=2 Tax=Virgibacillus phasianinus TaxID=2017483 RepID=A0A220U7I7_9BACI|nr:hypothetical protein [Virgibacillus phasianinus]ASK64244.1 hypothetical protein CFK37_00580 [Virgibacillus phasianinus]
MFTIFLFLLGFGLAVAGGVVLITYMNFIPAGLAWADFFSYIVVRPECYFLPIGFILIIIALYRYPN